MAAQDQDIRRVRVFHPRDTELNWSTENPLLGKGEVVISAISPTSVKIKVGDGANRFNSLPYAGSLDSDLEVHAAIPSTNPGAPTGGRIYETSTAGTYVNFIDKTGAAIVVASGQYVRLIDEGQYWSKVVVPGSISGLATDADVRNWINSLYALDFIQQPNRAAAVSFFNVNQFAPGGNRISVPQVGHWYVDMRQSFDVSRLNGVTILGGLGVPGDSSTVEAAIVTISPNGAITFLANSPNPTSAPATFTGFIDLTNEAKTVSGATTRTAYGIRGFVAIRTTATGSGGDTIALGNPEAGNQVWQYTNAAGNALVAKLLNTTISYSVVLYPEPSIQTELNLSRLQTAITKRNAANQPGNSAYYASFAATTILFDTTGWTVPAEVYLPRWNVPTGKIFIVVPTAGPQAVQVKGAEGALMNMTGNMLALSTGETAWFQFDGTGYYQIG